MSKSSNGKDEINKYNLDLFTEYMCWREEHGADSISTRSADEGNIKQFLEWLGEKRLISITKLDVMQYSKYLRDFAFIPAKGHEKKKYSETTIFQKRKCIKVFLKWLHKEYNVIDLTSEIKLKTPKTERHIEKPLDWDDIDRLLSACQHPRDRAMIHFLMDAGVRRGELLSIRYGDVSFIDGALQVLVPPSKKSTEHRRVYCVRCARDMRIWAEQHPVKSKDSYFFCSLHQPHGKYSKQGQHEQLRVIAERAGFEEKIYNHLFRHSSASLYCQIDGMNSYKINRRYGWASSSVMADTYIHLTGRESDDDIKRAFGQPVSKKVDNKNVKICPRCHLASPDTSDRCDNCGKALSAAEIAKEEAFEAEKEKMKMLELKNIILQEMREESEKRQKEFEERIMNQQSQKTKYKDDELKKGRRIINPHFYDKDKQ